MENDLQDNDILTEIKKEPKEECFTADYQEEPLKTLVLRFKRDENGNYSVVPLIKPDPFFEENLEDFCHEEIYSLVKFEEPQKAETDCKVNDIIIKQEKVDQTNIIIDKGELNKSLKRKYVKENNKIIRCSKCMYINNSNKKVKRHMQRVHPTQTQSCGFCDKKDFKEPISLEAHILTNHSDVKEAMTLITRKIFFCDFCRYRSLKRGNFRRHLTTHGDKKLKNLLQKQNDVNMNSVVEESENEIKMALKRATYNCYHCSYKTKDKGSIVKHVRLHKSFNYMPFLCTVCNRKFNEKNSLDSHIVKRHINNPEILHTVTNRVYECELCNYKDVNKNKVIRHKRARHIKKERKRKKVAKRSR